MYIQQGSANDDHFRQLFSPAQIDQLIRQAIQFCWLGLPKDRRTPDETERQIRRIVDRALKDYRDDLTEFHADPSTEPN